MYGFPSKADPVHGQLREIVSRLTEAVHNAENYRDSPRLPATQRAKGNFLPNQDGTA
jgi:hypothetical protein